MRRTCAPQLSARPRSASTRNALRVARIAMRRERPDGVRVGSGRAWSRFPQHPEPEMSHCDRPDARAARGARLRGGHHPRGRVAPHPRRARRDPRFGVGHDPSSGRSPGGRRSGLPAERVALLVLHVRAEPPHVLDVRGRPVPVRPARQAEAHPEEGRLAVAGPSCCRRVPGCARSRPPRRSGGRAPSPRPKRSAGRAPGAAPEGSPSGTWCGEARDLRGGELLVARVGHARIVRLAGEPQMLAGRADLRRGVQGQRLRAGGVGE